jgi:hypothetical protein
MRKLLPVLLVLLSVTAAAAADETWKGVTLVDTACSAKVKDAPDSHTASCAIACAKSGFGIIASDGQYLKFDEAGNNRALAALKATKKTDHLRATVVGVRDGETIKVKTISLD